jgi:hypothetical protein
MNTFLTSTAVALLFGLITYSLLRFLFWDIDIGAFGSIIGLGAAAGAGLGAWIARRRAATARTPETSREAR